MTGRPGSRWRGTCRSSGTRTAPAPRRPAQPAILVVGGVHDPATPLAWARGLAADVDGSVLRKRLDDGHTGC
ncbi:alpha/beta hydrolase [Amycolatopsis sp. NPDC051903]|uniref:alpha/beta hydrolase n=1 Tax=Amycolatopsis sp. NPDC051903 TaxID=3363936 RepID=UPI0037A81AA0